MSKNNNLSPSTNNYFIKPLTNTVTKFTTVDIPVIGIVGQFKDPIPNFAGALVGQYIKDFSKINLGNVTTPFGDFNCTYAANAISGGVKNVIKGKPFYTGMASNIATDLAKDYGYNMESAIYTIKATEKVSEYVIPALIAARTLNPFKAGIELNKVGTNINMGFMIGTALVFSKEVINYYCGPILKDMISDGLFSAIENLTYVYDSSINSLYPIESYYDLFKSNSECLNFQTESYNYTVLINNEINNENKVLIIGEFSHSS
ncbi:MAG: hypothetical protein K0R94_1540 [Burkholderiales bacterium]|jgi:hypothetical protein|nr:hypothetical protein [Burkholderiales bacterium]